MKSYLKSILAGKNLANFSFASSLVLHVGVIALFSSSQWVFESPKATQQKVVKIKLIPSSIAQKNSPSATSRKTAHFLPARPQNIHSPSIPTLAARSPILSGPTVKSASRIERTRMSPNRQFKPRKIQHLPSSVEAMKSPVARITNTSSQNRNSVQPISVRTSPTLSTSSSKSSQPTKPVTAQGPGQPIAARHKPHPSPIHISKVSPTAFQNALPMESTQEKLDKIDPRVVPISQHPTTPIESSLTAQQVAKHFASTQKLGFKSAALPRKRPQSSPTGPDGDHANLNTLRGQFTGQVRQRIAEAKYYPRIARRRGMEGQPIIAFTLTRGGGLLRANLIQTSGFQLLDEAALEAVQQAAPYPEIPAELKTETYQFKLPISFILK